MHATFELPGPVDLVRTMGPLLGPAESVGRVAAGEAWRASHTPAGPSTLRLVMRTGAVDAEAWGAGAEWSISHVPALLGFGDDPSTFKPDNPLLRDLHLRAGGMRFGATLSVFEVLVPTILGQKVTTKESHRGYRRLIEAHGSIAPGPGDLRLPPPPEVLADLPYFEYHPLGIERKRADTIRGVAARADRLEEIVTMSRDEAVRRLTAFDGIGPWTAQMVSLRALADPDAFPAPDLGLVKGARRALGIESARELETRSQQWRPWRAYAAAHLWRAAADKETL